MITPSEMDKMHRDKNGNIPEFDYVVKKDLRILDNPKADLLMQIAWDYGHSGGYYEVYHNAQVLAELIL